MRALDALFAPRAVAVLGASRDPAKLGSRLLDNVRVGGFAGRIVPVHPSGERILGLPSVASVEALPDDVDLALVSLPAPAVPAALEALARRGVGAAVILSSGFGEVDDAGRDVQGALIASARAAGLRLVGPNCMGVYSAPVRLNGTYFWDLPKLPGGIAVVSQSGAYGGLIFRHLGARGLGVARFLSIGNQADVEVAEVVEYLADDPETTLIACFVEALADGARFVRAAARATATKPLVVLKGGRSDAGRRAAGSHTGSLAGSYEVYRAAFRRGGAVLAEETEEFFDAIEALVASGGRRPAAPRVAVITVSGGPSVVAADCAERSGLIVPALGEATRRRLRELLPPFAGVGNPVDLTPQVAPERIAEAVGVVMAEPGIAGAIAVNVGLDIPEFADGVVQAMRATGKPVVAFTADAPVIADRFGKAGIPVLPSPERAVRAWRALWTATRSVQARRDETTHPDDTTLARRGETTQTHDTTLARSDQETGVREAAAARSDERAGPLAAARAAERSASSSSDAPPGPASRDAITGCTSPESLVEPRGLGHDIARDATRTPTGTSVAGVSARAGSVRARMLDEETRRVIDVADGPLPYTTARRLLEAYGVRFCPERIAVTSDEAVAAAGAIGYPVVVKADAPGLAHKTEAGAVRLDLRSTSEVAAACAELSRAFGLTPGAAAASVTPGGAPRGTRVTSTPVAEQPGTRPAAASAASVQTASPPRFIVQARVGPGVELLVGARRDETFGPVVLLGTGGVLAEAIADVSLRLAPLPEDEAHEMLAEGLRPRLLAGPRGLPAVDPTALVGLLQAVADLIVAEPRILEIDLNPVIAAGAALIAVDALVIVGETGRRP